MQRCQGTGTHFQGKKLPFFLPPLPLGSALKEKILLQKSKFFPSGVDLFVVLPASGMA